MVGLTNIVILLCSSYWKSNPEDSDFQTITIMGATKKGTRGALGPPNKEQNWENKEQNGGKKFQNGAFLGYGNSCKYLLKDQV